MTRLSKRDVERLLENYDADPVGALCTALALVGADSAHVDSIVALSTSERDALVRDLVEWRGLTPP